VGILSRHSRRRSPVCGSKHARISLSNPVPCARDILEDRLTSDYWRRGLFGLPQSVHTPISDPENKNTQTAPSPNSACSAILLLQTSQKQSRTVRDHGPTGTLNPRCLHNIFLLLPPTIILVIPIMAPKTLNPRDGKEAKRCASNYYRPR
jgi:hypothetical protein